MLSYLEENGELYSEMSIYEFTVNGRLWLSSCLRLFKGGGESERAWERKRVD